MRQHYEAILCSLQPTLTPQVPSNIQQLISPTQFHQPDHVGGLTFTPLGSLPLGGGVPLLTAWGPPQGDQAYYHPGHQQYAPPDPQITQPSSIPLALAPLRELEIPSFNGDGHNFENWYASVEAVLTQPM